MKRWLGCGGVAAIVVLMFLGALLWGVSVYNQFTRKEVQVDSAWSEVENNYQRRSDLVPNLVATVKGAADFERGTLEAVIAARAKATQMVVSPEVLNDPQKFKQFQQVQGELSSALSRLMAVVENYPQLKANQNYLDLQNQLEGTENRIAVARKRFNDAVADYNTAIKVFPGVVVARALGKGAKPFFEAEAGAEKAPKVQF